MEGSIDCHLIRIPSEKTKTTGTDRKSFPIFKVSLLVTALLEM